jgi:protein-tyrosine kinase
MTILDALEQAKRLHAQSRREGRKEDTDAGPRRKRPDIAPVTPLPIAPLEFTRLELNPAICDQNRILISNAPKNPYARAADSYRMLRTRLRSRLRTDGLSSFGITSSGADEGKSLTAVNLALSFASEKRRNVFLLDLDLRNPSLCRYLGVSPKVELGDALLQTVPIQDVFFTVGIDNLVLAGGVNSYENSSELLGTGALVQMLEFIAKSDPNALVIVDLPPLLQSADALVVAPHLSSMLLVVADGVARRDHLRRATELIASMNLAGVVLNRSREAIEDYYG